MTEVNYKISKPLISVNMWQLRRVKNCELLWFGKIESLSIDVQPLASMTPTLAGSPEID
jgi:hypothetical protein